MSKILPAKYAPLREQGVRNAAVQIEVVEKLRNQRAEPPLVKVLKMFQADTQQSINRGNYKI